MLDLALDVLIIVLLSVVLALGLVLHRRLRRFRQDNAGLEHLVTGLVSATDRAEAALEELKRTAAAAGERLGEDQAKAQHLSDDLRRLSGRADQLAERLARMIRVARPLEASGTSGRSVAAANVGAAPPAPAMSPEDLERALRTLR